MAHCKHPPVVITQDESDHLFEITHKGTRKARVLTRARILAKLAKMREPLRDMRGFRGLRADRRQHPSPLHPRRPKRRLG